MANESGDMKLLGNFSKLIELVSTNPDYNPANAKLELAALKTQKQAALVAVANIGTQEAPYKGAVNGRQDLFEGLSPVVSRVGNMAKASGASQKILDDLRTVSRKITGRRASAKIKDDPSTPENEAAKSHSASQMSYENIVGNVDDLIALVATIPSYAPNENDLKITELTALANDLKAKNEI